MDKGRVDNLMTTGIGIHFFDAPTVMEGYINTSCKQDDEGHGFFELAASTTGVLIGITNLIVVAVVLFGGRKLRKATFYCICNLAVADMLAGFLLLWIFYGQRVLLSTRSPYSELYQKSLWALTIWASMLSQLLIAVDRFCYVTQGYGDGMLSSTKSGGRNAKWGNKNRKRGIKLGIAATWLLPILTYVVPVITTWNCANSCGCYLPLNSTSGVYYMICSPISQCSQTNPPFTKGSMLYQGFSLLFMPAMPCILYAKIFHFVHRSAKKFTPKNVRPSLSNGDRHDYGQEPHSLLNEHSYYQARRHSVLQPPADSCSHSHVAINDSPTVNPSYSQRRTSVDGDHQSVDLQKTKGLSWGRRAILERFFNRNPKKHGRNDTRERSKSLMSFSGIVSTTKSRPTGANVGRRRRQRDMRLLQTLIIILSLFVVSTVPLGILFIASYTEMDKRYVFSAKILLTTTLINSLLNPWIYFWRFPEMRSALGKFFCHCKCGKTRLARHRYGDSLPPKAFNESREKPAWGSQNRYRVPKKEKLNFVPAKDTTSSSNSAL